MRVFPAALLALALAGPIHAEDTSALQAKKQEKLASAYFKAAAWTTDFDQARSAAKAGGKLIFGYFNRSYSY